MGSVCALVAMETIITQQGCMWELLTRGHSKGLCVGNATHACSIYRNFGEVMYSYEISYGCNYYIPTSTALLIAANAHK